MTHATQQLFRFLFPGLATAIGTSAILSGNSPTEFISDFELSTKTIGAPLVLAFLVSGVYWATGAARHFRRWTFKRTGGRVLQRLCDFAAQRGVNVLDPTVPSFQKCVESQWYRLIDEDKQLTIKSESIRMNGTMATSAIEVVVVGAVFLVLFVCFGPTTGRLQWLWLCAALMVVALVVFVAARREHVKLVDEQIDIAERHLGPKILSGVEACNKPK